MRTALLLLLMAVTSGASAQTPGTSSKPGVERPATITDNYGNRRGYVQPSGEVRDNYGNRVGYIKPDGKVFDAYGNQKGTVQKK